MWVVNHIQYACLIVIPVLQVGLLMSSEQSASSKRTSLHAYDNPVLMHTPPHDPHRDNNKLTGCTTTSSLDSQQREQRRAQQTAARSGLTLDLEPEGTHDDVEGAENGVRAIEDSPLDLPTTPPREGGQNENNRLPNVLLDT